MKTLFLVRHAKSSWKYPELDDFERPLNKRGRKNAPLMGKILRQLKVKPDLIISSPANRAAMTSRIIADKIHYPLVNIQYDESIYYSNDMNLMRIITGLDNGIKEVMLVGHNPELTLLANTLGNYPISNIPTSGVFCVGFDISAWSKIEPSSGELKFFEFPKNHP